MDKVQITTIIIPGATCSYAPAGLYLTRGDGVAALVTAEMLRAALGWHHSSACNTSAFVKSDGPCNCGEVARAENVLAKLMEPSDEH
jgi:hypothetical protein